MSVQILTKKNNLGPIYAQGIALDNLGSAQGVPSKFLEKYSIDSYPGTLQLGANSINITFSIENVGAHWIVRLPQFNIVNDGNPNNKMILTITSPLGGPQALGQGSVTWQFGMLGPGVNAYRPSHIDYDPTSSRFVFYDCIEPTGDYPSTGSIFCKGVAIPFYFST